MDRNLYSNFASVYIRHSAQGPAHRDDLNNELPVASISLCPMPLALCISMSSAKYIAQ